MKSKPKFSYLKAGNLLEGIRHEHAFRVLECDGRSGLNAESIYSRIIVPQHTVNDNEGSFTFWMMPIEELGSKEVPVRVHDFEDCPDNYTLITDNNIEFNNPDNAAFSLVYRLHFADQLTAKFFVGRCDNAWQLYPHRAYTEGGILTLKKDTWYQVGLTWNRSESKYRVYINGVLFGTSAVWVENQINDVCGPYLFMGNPALAFSGLDFYDKFMEPEDFARLFEQQATKPDEAYQKALRHRHAGEEMQRYSWEPDSSWTKKVDMKMNTEEDLDRFYVQGCKEAPTVTDEGLLITTRFTRTEAAYLMQHEKVKPGYDPDQVYFWLKDWFEGDLALEYEFNPLVENGLSVLVVQASGMHHEDFMKDYPLPTSGAMRMIYGENIRDYDWEYFRQMDDVRHDINSGILIKNPYFYPLGYQCMPERLEINQWHKIQFVQEGGHIVGTIDGQLIFDCTDTVDKGAGHILNCGHIAIRAMWKTKMMVRNLKVYNKAPKYTVKERID
jgi:hypothetical protein